jgi:hypothetical protein
MTKATSTRPHDNRHTGGADAVGSIDCMDIYIYPGLAGAFLPSAAHLHTGNVFQRGDIADS